ncbi:MAG: hypothetical protein K8U03_09365 [Planctomycetia bacterium]|nr:hypothetical protein [Planctomycetia bacterium]
MPKVINECNGCSTDKSEHARPDAMNGMHPEFEYTDISDLAGNSKRSAAELLEQLRLANKQIVLQSQRIEELQGYLTCIVSLSAKVRELELDASL